MQCVFSHDEKDGKLALELMRSFGAVPERNQAQLQVAAQMAPEDTLNKYRREAAIQMANHALERHAVYGSSLPMEQEELRQLVEKSLGEKVPDDFLDDEAMAKRERGE